MDVCRACLSSALDMVLMDHCFVAKYNLLTCLNVQLNDGLPQQCCKACIGAVEHFVNFRDKCRESESNIRSLKVEFEIVGQTENMKSEMMPECKLKEEDIKKEEEESNTEYEYVDEISLSQLLKDENDFMCKISPTQNKNKLRRKSDKGELLYEDDFTELSKNDSKRKTSRRSKQKKMVKIIKLEKNIQIIGDNDTKLLNCGLCTKTFIDQNVMNNHIETHSKYKKCEICFQIFVDWPQLLCHRIIHLPSKQRTCHICLKKTATALSMEYHYLKTHYDQKKFIGIPCRQCTSYFETPRQLTKHVYSTHSTRTYICDYCSKVVHTKQNLATHVRCHMDQKQFCCDLCEFSCKYSGGLKNHKIRRHTLTKVYCDKCKEVFCDEEARSRHRCKTQLRVCPVCGKQFASNKSLNRHSVSHETVCKYKCERCPAVYKSRGALAVHVARHDGVRSQQCEYCPAKFYTLGVLIKHRRTHTGEKPFVCKICNKGFTGRHNLKVHMKVHGEMLVVKKNKVD